MDFLFLGAGLILLTLAGDALVHGAVGAADRMRIPSIVTGLTIVAFGTSAPELIVSVEAALSGEPGLAIGNAIGSNISNSLLVLGLPAIISPIILNEAGIRRSSVFMILNTACLIFMMRDLLLSPLEGLILFALLILYLTYSGVHATQSRSFVLANIPSTSLSTPKILLSVGLGILGLGIGGKLTTDGAIGIANTFGIASSAIGLTVVALGTSLPELATSLAAARRGQTGVVIGNVIGSNIFNLLGILGITAMLVPLNVSATLYNFDIWVLLLATAAIIPIAFSTRRINRVEGLVMTAAYIVYAIVALRNGMAA